MGLRVFIYRVNTRGDIAFYRVDERIILYQLVVQNAPRQIKVQPSVGRVVRTLDLRSVGYEFESWLPLYRVQPWASC